MASAGAPIKFKSNKFILFFEKMNCWLNLLVAPALLHSNQNKFIKFIFIWLRSWPHSLHSKEIKNKIHFQLNLIFISLMGSLTLLCFVEQLISSIIQTPQRGSKEIKDNLIELPILKEQFKLNLSFYFSCIAYSFCLHSTSTIISFIDS